MERTSSSSLTIPTALFAVPVCDDIRERGGIYSERARRAVIDKMGGVTPNQVARLIYVFYSFLNVFV